MKRSLLLFAIFGISLSVQEGYYHKQYQYKSSSSSYKNNELQHKTDDEEFSSVHGDLSGRDDPKVNAYTQHTEYRNPNAQDGQVDTLGGNQFHGVGGSNRYQTPNVGYGVNPDDVTGSIAGQRKHISYSGTYTVSGGQASNQLRGGTYDTPSNLLDLTQKVQNNLSNQLSRVISQHRTYGSHSSSSAAIENEIQSLEDELRANLTRKLQEELNTQYGSQTRRGSHSYSLSQTRPNYNTQELDDLTQQVQTNLFDQLRREYQTQSSSSSSQSSYSSSGSYGNTQNAYIQPSKTTYHYQPVNHQVSSSDYSSRAHTTMYRQEVPTIRPNQSLLDVTSKAQIELDMILNTALSYLKTKYMNDDTYKSVYQPDYDIILNDLTDELKRNITTEIDTALRNAYGLQEERNGYYFSTWNVNANIANYKIDDLENLKKQVEKNLLEKLTQEVRNQKSSYTEKRTQYLETKRRTETQTYSSWNRYPSTTYNTNNNNQHTSQSSQSQYSSSSSYGGNVQPVYPLQTRDDQQQTEDFSYYNTNRYPSNTYSQRNTHRDDQQQVEEIDYQYKPQTQRPTSYVPSDSSRYPSTGNAYSTSHSSNSESSYQYVSGNRQSGLQTSQLPTAEITRIRDELNQDLSQQVQRVIQQQRDDGRLYSSSQTSQATVDDLTEEFKRNFSRRVEEVLKEHGVRGGYSFTISGTSGMFNGQNKDKFAESANKLQEELLRQLREGLSRQSYHSSSSSSSSSSHSYQPVKYTSTYGGSSGYSSGSYGMQSGSYGGHLGGYGTHTGGYGTHTGGLNSANYERSNTYQMQSGFREVDYQQSADDCMQSDEATSSKTIKPPRARADIPADLEVAPQDTNPTEKPKARDVVTNRTPKTSSTSTPQTPQHEDLTQQTQKLEGLTQDISRQLETLNQQQIVDFNNFNPHSSDLTQQTENFGQLNQHSSDLTQQTQDFKYFDQQTSDLTQQTQDFKYFDQQSSDLTQQTEDFNHSDLTQKTENIQQSSGYTLQSKPNKNDDLIQHTVDNQEIIHLTENVPKVENKKDPETVTEETTTTEKPGFWKKLGGKITSGFNTVKDKIESIG